MLITVYDQWHIKGETEMNPNLIMFITELTRKRYLVTMSNNFEIIINESDYALIKDSFIEAR